MEYLPHMPNSSKLHTDMDALQYEHLAEHSTSLLRVFDLLTIIEVPEPTYYFIRQS